MTRFFGRSVYCRLTAALFVSIGFCGAAEAQTLSQRMTGPARFVYNWAGSGPVAAQVMGMSRARSLSTPSAPRLNVQLFRFNTRFFSPQYWSRSSSFGRR